jgi:hypothetical protein
MKNTNLLKKLFIFLLIVAFLFPASTKAYVSVSGYFRNGKYVQPYVRSNPNGLKFDNYSWTPSQGLFNKTYGTRGLYWDTPTYITDPNYYQGQAIYNSLNNGFGSYYNQVQPQDVFQPATSGIIPGISNNNYTGYIPQSTYQYTSNIIPATIGRDAITFCTYGYKKISADSCEKISLPANASLNYEGSDWGCNSGYRKNNSQNTCEVFNVPLHTHLISLGVLECDRGYQKDLNTGACVEMIIPQNAILDSDGKGWTCDRGYRKNYAQMKCDLIFIPQNATLNQLGNGWYCNPGYFQKNENSCAAIQ